MLEKSNDPALTAKSPEFNATPPSAVIPPDATVNPPATVAMPEDAIRNLGMFAINCTPSYIRLYYIKINSLSMMKNQGVLSFFHKDMKTDLNLLCSQSEK